MINNKKKALIHIAKLKTGMSEDEYRAMLAGIGVKSSKDLDSAGFKAAMEAFEKLGFISRDAQPGRLSKKQPKPAAGKSKMMSKIYAILTELDYPREYADGMAKRMFKIDKLLWCSPAQLHKITAALVYHQTRKKAQS